MSASEPSPFGDLLRRQRLAAGLSQERLAEQTGLSVRGISDLERGLRRAPRLETLRRLAAGLDLDPAGRADLLRAARPAPNTPGPSGDAAIPSHIPISPNPLIGRERELVEIVSLLRDPVRRLVTLTGPGGVGKTRLALESATATAESYAGSAHVVELAPLRDPALVLQAIAQTLGVQVTGAATVRQALTHFLRDRRLLLVLDNLEHLLPATTDIAALLSTSAGLTILATSRVPLSLQGEQQYPVPPLALPNGSTGPSAARILDTEAVRLFVARARQVRRDFTVRDTDAPAIAAICRRLDGLPLALELAAAHARALPPAALLARLDRRLPLLRHGAQDLPDRQRTLHATIAWSHDLLEPDERRLFRRLAVFAGGWTFDAAEAVIEDTGIDALEGLTALVNASMIVPAPDPSGEPRFTMLETIREFATEQLEASGEAARSRDRHAEWCLSIAQAGAANLADAAQAGWLAQLLAEEPNMRVALAWLRDSGQPGQGLRLATTLGAFWRLRSANTEGRGWMEAFLTPAALSTVSDLERVAALRWAGELAGLEGDMATAQSRLDESLAIARRVDDTHGITAALAAMGSMAVQRGEIVASVSLFEEGAAHARQLGDHRQTAFLTAYLAFALSHLGDLARAESLVSESQALLRQLGDVRSFEATFTAMVEGWVAVISGQHDRAMQAFEETLDLGRELDSKAILSATLAGIGEIELARGRVGPAAECFRDGLVEAHEGGWPPGTAFNLQGLVRVAVNRGDLARAARLAAALETVPISIGAMPTAAQSSYATAMSRLRQALDEETLRAETDRGRFLRPDQLIDDATALTNPNSTAPP